MDMNSIVNQNIKRKFVEREVMTCMTNIVEFILKCEDECSSQFLRNEAPFTRDDVENFFQPYCSNCGEGHNSFTKDEDDDGNTTMTCDDCGRAYSENEWTDLDSEPAEVYEWWAVTDWLGSKLKARGEVVIETYCFHLWGRQGTGQAILLDGVISDICEGMGILDGQEYSWADKLN